MMTKGAQFIGNIRSGKGKVFYSNDAKEKFYEATESEINEAVQKAFNAFLLYRNLPAKVKANFLEQIASGIDASRNILLNIAVKETSLANARLNGEINRTINQIKLFIELLKEGAWVKAIIDPAQPERTPMPKPNIRQMQKPIGAIAVFGASNFPFAFSIAGGDTISALAAGCTVVYKAHPGHPILSELVAQIIIDAAQKTNMPDGVFSMIYAFNVEPATHLVKHPLIKAVAFTGSFKAGKAIYSVASKREEPIPVYAEMGSTNPVFILPEMLQQKGDEIAKALAASNLLSAGQFCTNPGIIISNKSADTEKFQNTFSDCIAAATGETMLTDSIFNSYQQNIEKISELNEVKIISNNNKTEKQNVAIPNMFSVSADTFLSQKELKEEIFGPASIHVVTNSEADFIKIAEALPGQLTITVWGTDNDISNYSTLINYLELKAGRIIINDVPTGVEVTHAMMHGGPYPATTDSKFTSVGTTAIYRFTRPVCYQNFDNKFLPEALQNNNPLNIIRMVNGKYTNNKIE